MHYIIDLLIPTDELQQPDASSAIDVRKSRELSTRITKLLRSESAFYTIRRLLAADQKDLYNKYYSVSLPSEFEGDDDEKELRFESDWIVMPNGNKGGLSLTSYLTYGSLYGDELEPNPEEWTCPICDTNMMRMPLELLCHNVECKRKKDEGM